MAALAAGCILSEVHVEPSINGANVIQTRRALEELVGRDVVSRALESVPPETAEAYTTVTPVGSRSPISS